MFEPNRQALISGRRKQNNVQDNQRYLQRAIDFDPFCSSAQELQTIVTT